MKPSIIETIPISTILHLGLLLFVAQVPEVNTLPEVTKIEINYSNGQKPLKSQSPHKYAKSLETKDKSVKSHINDLGSGSNQEENEPIDLTEYANRVKLKVDPIWIRKITPYLGKYSGKLYLEILVRITNTGKITSTKILKSSGNVNVDRLAIDTFKEANTLPKPPKSKEILEQGIIWEFTI